MRFAAFPLAIILALTTVSCSAEQTPATPAAAATTDTQTAPSDTPDVSAMPTETPSGPLGSISGKILPPPVAQPATVMKIIAREINLGKVYSADIPLDQEAYTISSLPMGTYYVFGWYYPDGIPGAYTDSGVAVVETSTDQLKCGNSLLPIVLTERKPDFQGADLACWAGDYFIYFTPTP
jgi:hypothetical protein